MHANLQSLSAVITITGYDLFTSIRTRGGSPKGIDPTFMLIMSTMTRSLMTFLCSQL